MLLQWTLSLGIFWTIKGTQAENLTTTVHLPRSRPDWILLVTPGCALVLGVLLFSLLVSLQRRSELRKRVALNRRRRLNEALKFGHRLPNSSSNHSRSAMNGTSPVLSKASLDNLSYENVDVNIYSNDFPEPNDYLTADDAVTGGAQPGREADWTRVIVQDCPPAAGEQRCDSGCLLPTSLSLRFLWAHRGHLSLPQAHILGAKLTFHCRLVQVSFADATVLPQSPRGRLRPESKRPLDFFFPFAERAAAAGVGPQGPAWPPLCIAVSLLSLLVYC
ncbi:TECT3 protein, partial [Atractosteus spatula]|nr:TECT3 protein [Atractosteus spatula]